MNFRRGLFRLWIIGSALFVLAVAFVGYSGIKEQFTAVASTFEVQLPDGRTFEVQAPDMQTATAMVKTLPENFVPDKPLRAMPNPWATLGMWQASHLAFRWRCWLLDRPYCGLCLGSLLNGSLERAHISHSTISTRRRCLCPRTMWAVTTRRKLAV
jgi:hypothetical protein